MLKYILFLILLVGCSEQVVQEEFISYSIDNYVVQNNLTYNEVMQFNEKVYTEIYSLDELNQILDLEYDGVIIKNESIRDEVISRAKSRNCNFNVVG